MKSTVISIYPFALTEEKPGLLPAVYNIPAGTYEKPSILYVNDARYFIPRALDQPPIVAFEGGDIVARAIVEDFTKAQLEFTTEAHPGLMWAPGEIKEDQVKYKFAEELKILKLKQDRWFMKLVEKADDDWNKFHHYRSITDVQRRACEFLKLKREWTSVEDATKFIDCPACMTRIRDSVVVCPHCKVIVNEQMAAKLRFAGQAEQKVS